MYVFKEESYPFIVYTIIKLHKMDQDPTIYKQKIKKYFTCLVFDFYLAGYF